MTRYTTKVAIIGAGAAGIAAALRLGEAGVQTRIIEARERIGGRAYSDFICGAAQPIEYGPEFIHGRPAITHEMLKRFGISRIDTANESWSLENNVLRPDNDDYHAEEALLSKAIAMLEPTQDMSIARALDNVTTPETQATRDSILGMVRGFDAADPQLASVRAIAEEWRGDANLSSTSSRIIGGYRALWHGAFEALQKLPVDTHFSSTVQRITRQAEGVVITAATPEGETLEIEAEYAVVTVPIGVLHTGPDEAGHIDWIPPLPVAITDALSGLVSGPVVKLLLHFETAFWEELEQGAYGDAAFFHCGSAAPFPVLWTSLPIRSTVLTAWVGGSDVEHFAGADLDELTEAAFETIGVLFGKGAKDLAKVEFCRAYIHDWQADPYARGAYSYVRVGGGKARQTLAQAIHERIFLAGEAYAIDGEGGTVAGALISGDNAAQKILEQSVR